MTTRRAIGLVAYAAAVIAAGPFVAYACAYGFYLATGVSP